MKAAKLFSFLVIGIVGLYGAVGLYFLPLADFEGDLTRMAKLPESQFGWNRPQPRLEPDLFGPVSWQDADVLVLGDSFSVGDGVRGRVWQTVLARQGLKVRSEHWASVRGVCEDFPEWLRKQGFRGKWIVFEMVERNIESGFPKSVDCKHVVYHHSVEAEKPHLPPHDVRPPASRSAGRMSVGLEVALNERAYLEESGKPGFEGKMLENGIRMARVPGGCELFSHVRCQDALFLNGDNRGDVDLKMLDLAETVNSRLEGIKPIWVFVPDKSTTYLHPEKQFWNEAERRLSSPNMLRVLRQALDAKTVDLYPGNNSHLSTTGYLMMGAEILKAMRQAGLETPR